MWSWSMELQNEGLALTLLQIINELINGINRKHNLGIIYLFN